MHFRPSEPLLQKFRHFMPKRFSVQLGFAGLAPTIQWTPLQGVCSGLGTVGWGKKGPDGWTTPRSRKPCKKEATLGHTDQAKISQNSACVTPKYT